VQSIDIKCIILSKQTKVLMLLIPYKKKSDNNENNNETKENIKH